MKIFLIFPHQLYENVHLLRNYDCIYLIEEFLYFKQYLFHKQKIRLHRSSMKYYEEFLKNHKIPVTYIESIDEASNISVFFQLKISSSVNQIDYYDPTDYWLSNRIEKGIKSCNIKSTVFESPNFINTSSEILQYFSQRKRLLHHDFYVFQRKKWNILLENNAQPTGGKWSFDEDNRKKYPSKKSTPTIQFPEVNSFVKEANQYVATYFSKHLGELDFYFRYPCTHQEAKNWLNDFINQRLSEFGIYEDAIVNEENILHHSLLAPLLNIGLLNPKEVIDAIIHAFNQKLIPINSAEGIIRQLIGWREFVRGIYLRQGTHMRNQNFWNFSADLSNDFYSGTTGIIPFDKKIHKILQTAYCHHIERLMILGNFFLLNKIHPNKTYQWFMEMFIDAYDWVMVPNVYGMSQFSDGGSMVTKPYISSSNYIIKMSNYASNKNWCAIWDALYWQFIAENRDFFSKNSRLQFAISMYDKFTDEKKELQKTISKSYFQRKV